MECNIVTEGDGLIELWVKETDELDVPTGSAYYGRGKEYLPIILRWNRLEDNNFIFTDSDLHNLQPGPSASTIAGAQRMAKVPTQS